MGLVPLQGLLTSAFARICFEPKFSVIWEVDFPPASQLDIVIGLFVTANRDGSSRGIPPRVLHFAASFHRSGDGQRGVAREVCPEDRIERSVFAASASLAAPEGAAASGGGMAMIPHRLSWGF